MLTRDGGLSADGTIQERMRWPGRTGTEVARTAAVRVTHTPSHYAMLGVPRDFTDAQLRKQYRLLAFRYHPDAAERNGIDPAVAMERFQALQTAHSVLSDPVLRRRYDMETRLQHRREWRRAWDGSTLQLVDKSGAPPPPALGHSAAEEDGRSDGIHPAAAGPAGGDYRDGGEGSAGGGDEDVQAERARQWDAQRVAWLQQQLEEQEASLRRHGPIRGAQSALEPAPPAAPLAAPGRPAGACFAVERAWIELCRPASLPDH